MLLHFVVYNGIIPQDIKSSTIFFPPPHSWLSHDGGKCFSHKSELWILSTVTRMYHIRDFILLRTRYSIKPVIAIVLCIYRQRLPYMPKESVIFCSALTRVDAVKKPSYHSAAKNCFRRLKEYDRITKRKSKQVLHYKWASVITELTQIK